MEIPRDETVLQKPVSETRLARAVLEKLGGCRATCSADALRQGERIAAKVHDVEMRGAMAIWREYVETRKRIPCTQPVPWCEDPPRLGYEIAVGAGVDPEVKRFVRAGSEVFVAARTPAGRRDITEATNGCLGNVRARCGAG